MSFTQQITVEGAEDKAVHEHVAKWDSEQSGVAPGYLGARVLADGTRHLIEVDFSSEQDARRNNDRPETAQWAEGLKRLATSEPSYRDLRQVCTTYGG